MGSEGDIHPVTYRSDVRYRDLSRRQFLMAGSATLVCTSSLPSARGQAASSTSGFVEVKTAYGRVRGTRGNGLDIFKGIPYAGSVAGANRFKAAPPLASWSGVRDVLEFGAPSLQPGRGARPNEPAPAEDCLFLNVWTPAADGRKRPVMYYSHGGGFVIGSSGAPYQDASNLARTW